MPRLTQEEIDILAIKYVKLRDKSEDTGNGADILRFKAYQSICIQKLKELIVYHTKKYRNFPNHKDLEQDGFEALLHALVTFKPSKGSFAWWANKYIKTRVVRNANAHSTIKFPIKTAKETKPYKISTIPVQTDLAPLPSEAVEIFEDSARINEAINKLPNEHRQIVNMKYGFNGIREHSVGKILEILSISRQQYSKLLSEAEDQIKKHILRIEQ